MPQDWTVERLVRAATINDDTLPEGTDPNWELAYVDIGSVSLERGIERTEALLFRDAPSRARRLVRDGDVLVSTVRTYLKAIAPVVAPPVNLVASTGFAVVRPRPWLNPAFARFVLQARGFVDEVIARSTGVSYPAINASDLARIEIPCPPWAEQRAIASFLDRETTKIDALIAEQEKLIVLLAEKRLVTISHAVTRGLDTDAPIKNTDVPWLGLVPAHWDTYRVKTLTDFITSGPRGWSERIAEVGSLFIQSGDLDDVMGVDFSNAKRVVIERDAETARTRLQEGDVLVCITGAKTGNVAVCEGAPEDAYVNQHLCLLRPTSAVRPQYLALALKADAGRVQLDLAQYGLKQGLSLDDISNVRIALGPVDEQVRILDEVARIMAAINRLTDEAGQAIALLRERRSALITAAVTGQIDVRNTELVEA